MRSLVQAGHQNGQLNLRRRGRRDSRFMLERGSGHEVSWRTDDEAVARRGFRGLRYVEFAGGVNGVGVEPAPSRLTP